MAYETVNEVLTDSHNKIRLNLTECCIHSRLLRHVLRRLVNSAEQSFQTSPINSFFLGGGGRGEGGLGEETDDYFANFERDISRNVVVMSNFTF